MAVVDIEMAKEHLTIEGGAHDAALEKYIAGAIAAIGNLCGPLEPKTITRKIPGGYDEMALPVTPVISLTSITPTGNTALDIAGLDFDHDSGVISYKDGRLCGFTTRTYSVVYEAGYSECPDDLVLAVLELVRDLWSAAKRGKGRPGAGATNRTANTVPKTAGEMPFEVQKLIAPYIQISFS